MIELGLLGTTRVRSSGTDPSSLLARRKAFGLLVYMVVKPGSYHPRSVLCGLLWPETDESRARSSLRVALHRLREQLGPEAIRSRDDGAVGVDPEHVTSDVSRLLQAIEGGNAAEVARLYRGPLLSGFHSGAGPFDRWLEEERVSLERRSTDAIQEGAAHALSRGEWRHASALAADLLRVRPTSVPGIETRVEALVKLGAIGRALEDLDRFREHFEKELELPPPEHLDDLEETIRNAAPEDVKDPGGASEPATAPPRAEVPTATDPAPTAPEPDSEPAPEASPGRPAGLRVVGGVRTIAGLALAGSVALVSFLWTGDGPSAGARSEPHVPTTEARRLVEEGRELRNRGAFGEAVEAYRAAIAADSMWGEAHYELALAAKWAGWPDVTHAALERAVALSEGMSPIERDLTAALDMNQRREVIASRELYLEILERAPDDVRANMELGELEFHWGSTIGVPPETSRSRFERVAGLITSSEAVRHLARLDARAGDTAALGRRLRRLEEMDNAGALEEVRVLDVVARGEPPEVDDPGLGILMSVAATRAPRGIREAFFERVARASSLEPNRIIAMIYRAQVALSEGRLREAGEWLDSLETFTSARRDEFMAAALTLPFRGPAPGARAAMAARLDERAGDVLIAPTEADLSAPAIYAPRRIFLQALLRGAGRMEPDTTAFNSLAQRSWVDTAYINNHTRILRARARLESDADLEDALAALGPPSIRPGGLYPSVLAYPTAHKRYLRARILSAMGRDREALAWYRTFPDPRGYDIAFLPGVLLTRGRLETRLGMTEDAQATFRYLLELLAGSDPSYRPLITGARQELSRLERP